MIITREIFAEEYDDLRWDEVDPIDAILTILKKYELTEEQIPRLLNPEILDELRSHANGLNFMKPEIEPEVITDDISTENG